MKKWKLVFTKDGVTIFEKIKSPFGGNLKDIEIEKIEYGSLLENKNLDMLVTGIRPKIDGDVLKELIFEVEFEPKSTSRKITPNAYEKGIIIGDKKIPCSKYTEILINVAKWLFEHGRIKEENLPIYASNSGQYLLNSEPKHSYNKPFANRKEIFKGVYLNTNFNGDKCKKQARYLMDRFAPDINFQIFGFK